MASRFAQLAQRDSSVPMLRVKMSRRRLQVQKENRERAVSRHRGLNRLPELQDLEQVDHRTALSLKQDKKLSLAVEERKKMLARYKEAKELQKEKERRVLEKKGGVFRVGVYKPQPLAPLPQLPARAKATFTVPSNKATWIPQKPLSQKENVSAPRKAEPPVAKVKPRQAVRPRLAPPAGGCKTAPVERLARAPAVKAAKKPQTAPPPGRGKTTPGNAEPQSQAVENKPAAPEGEKVDVPTTPPLLSACPPEEGEVLFQPDALEGERPPSPSSFAPQGFVFAPPAGLSTFLPAPLDTPSKAASIAPSPSRDGAPPAQVLDPPAAPQPCPEPTCPSPAPPNPATPQPSPISQEPEHDVPYFRAVMASETDRLTGLCEQWDPRTDEPSIPEEMRERMLTAVGQARLLMRERFGQFQGLVDDCALGRGERTTTCTDLQGFWDMVFYQVEDVNRKFSALKEAESRGWKEERKPLPRVKRPAKKPPLAAAGNTAAAGGGGGGATAAARSRLAAVKAAMKAKRQAEPQPATETPAREAPADAQTVVFHGGFFQVESPAKVAGSVRRTSLLRAAVSPCSSPCPPSRVSTPRRRLPPAASCPSPAPGGTPTRQTSSALFWSLCLTPRPQPSPCSTALAGSPPPTHTRNTQRKECSGVTDHDPQPAPCPVSPTFCPGIPALCPVSSTPCPVVSDPSSGNPVPCTISPAICPANSTPCPESYVASPVSPTPCPISPPASPANPATYSASPVNPAPCLVGPASKWQSDHDYALLGSFHAELESKVSGQSAPPTPTPSPQEATSQSELIMSPMDVLSHSTIVPEVQDASHGQLELVSEPELGGSPPAHLVALNSSQQVEVVEDVGEFPTPCPVSPASCPINPTSCLANTTPCAISPAPSPISPSACPISPTLCLVSPVSPKPCPISPAPCLAARPGSPAACPISPTPCPANSTPSPISSPVSLINPAAFSASAVNPSPCLANPAPTWHSDHDYAQLSSPPGGLKSEVDIQAPPTPSPLKTTSQSGIGEVCLERHLYPADVLSQSTFVPELQDVSYGQSELAESELEGSPSTLLVAPNLSQQVEVVEDVGEFSTPCPVSPAPCPANSTPCCISPAPSPISPAACPITPTLCPVRPVASPVSPTPCPISPAPCPADCSINPTACPISPTPCTVITVISTPSPQKATSQSGVKEVYLERNVLNQSDYSPSQWQGLNFTLSPSAYPSTPIRGMLLSPSDSSPMGQTPPSTPGPLPLQLSSATPGSVADRSPRADAGVQTGPAAEMSAVADVQGSDFDCCAQLGLRCGLSPRAPVSVETGPSPGATAAVQMAGEVRADAASSPPV